MSLGALKPGTVLTFGETMGLGVASETGSLSHVTSLALSIGGAESNVAIGLQRLGIPSVWIGRVGDDALGRRVARELAAEGVGLRVLIDTEAPTGFMLKERTATGHSRVYYYRAGSAGSGLEAGDIPGSIVRAASMLHTTGITAGLSRTSAHAVEVVTDIATSAGVPISFDVNHRRAVWHDREPRSVYRSIAAKASIVFAGTGEAKFLVDGNEPRHLARAIQALGPREVVIKLGANGCFAVDGDEEISHDAVNVPVVDTVGAGDAFVAGYLAGRLAEDPLAERARLANAVGAFACLGPRDWEGLPTRADLDSLGGRDPVSR